jgi:hypothetical protein
MSGILRINGNHYCCHCSISILDSIPTISLQAPTTLVTKRSFQPSTIAISAKHATSQRLKLAKRSTGHIKQAKTTASSILVPKYIESLAFKEEQEENEPSRGKFKLNG